MSQQYTVAVRALCEFTAKAGDLDLRFTPSPTAAQGMAGHAVVASRRGAGYEAELSLRGDWQQLHVRGRADGFDAARNQLEEIKTHRGAADAIPANHRALHWAQLKVYGWLLCAERGLPELKLALVYYDIASQQETVVVEVHRAEELRAFFELQCGRFLAWAQQELAHRAARDRALAALAFPHPDFRPGQRPLAEAVYKSAVAGRHLLAQAPTGIGKTVGTLFPLLRAMPGQRIDKLFFLAAKTPGRGVALHALARLAPNGMPLRVVELVARDKACEHPDLACHGASCPLAQGFYDRLPAARQAAVAHPGEHGTGRAAVRTVALAHGVCPYYLAQDLVRWADVVVGDYNYWFDTSALLHALTQANEWRAALLVDEAHNLVERARSMYSATLAQADLQAVQHAAPAALKPPLGRLAAAWKTLLAGQAQAYQAHDDIPEDFLKALQKAAAAIADHLAEQPAASDAALQRFYFDALHFARMAEAHGAHSLFDATEPGGVLCVRNVVPAPFLKPRFAAAHSAALFSATLTPRRYHADLLGLPADSSWVDVASPFDAAQLQVRIAHGISTRYLHRERSLAPIADLIATQYAAGPGNYLAFFSSYDYLQQALASLQARHPGVPVWEQSRRMDEPARDAFLARFTERGAGVGFAVLGGAFAEGIDLPGRRLVGAFVATLGLPQVNPVNEAVRGRMAAVFADPARGADVGYDYTYLYPGLQKVVQAAGRVIRTTNDVGTVWLVDDRYARAEVRALLPAWWHVEGNGGGA